MIFQGRKPVGGVKVKLDGLDSLHVLYRYRKAMIAVTLLVMVGGIMQTYATDAAIRTQQGGTGVGAILLFVVPILLGIVRWARR